MQQVLDELLDHGEGDLPALLATRVVGLLGERGDQRRQVLLLDGEDARRARQRVVDRDPRRPRGRSGPRGARASCGRVAVAVAGPSPSARAERAASGAARDGTASGRGRARALREQPVEEGLHGGDEYSTAHSAPETRSASLTSGARLKRRELSTGCSRTVESAVTEAPEDPNLRDLWKRLFHRGVTMAPRGRPGAAVPAAPEDVRNRRHRTGKDLQKGDFRTTGGEPPLSSATRRRQRLIHGDREPVSTGNDSYPQYPQETVNRGPAPLKRALATHSGRGYTGASSRSSWTRG